MLSVPEVPEWKWSLVSSLEAFGSYAMPPGAGQAFEDIMEPGDAVFVFPDLVIYGSQGEFTKDFASKVYNRISALRTNLKF